MSRSDAERIADIIEVGGELESIVALGRAAFDRDLLHRRAAERLLEIIGEAANALSAETTARYPSVPWRDISRLRIVLAHHYHRVDPEQVWSVATEHVPALVAALNRG